jgi:F-type H+-transporting ATPase subunit epsilon
MPLTLEIVTPEAQVYSDTIDSVVIPTVEGEVGILPGHIPLLTQVEDGELQVTKNGKTELLVIGGGFAQVEGNRVRVLAEHAVTESAIDEKAVQAALERAEAQMKEAAHMDPNEFENLQSMVRFAGVQLAVKRRKH